MSRPENPKVVALLASGVFDGFDAGDWVDMALAAVERARLQAADKRTIRHYITVSAGGGLK